MKQLVDRIRWICFGVMVIDLFMKTGLMTWAFLVWTMTFIYTHSLMEKKFFDEQEKQEEKNQ